ncbi:MAG: extracellular solute-binding protein [Aestuariivirga sp.]
MFSPAAPDPAPRGVAKFPEEAFAKWQADNACKVGCDAVPWPQLHDKMATAFAGGEHVWDIVCLSGWVPEFAKYLVPFSKNLSADTVADLPKSSFSTVTWDGESMGAVFTLSLLTMFYNTEVLEKAGFKEAPKTWDELKAAAKACTRDGKFGRLFGHNLRKSRSAPTSRWHLDETVAGIGGP